MPSAPSRRVTLRDVAAELGVSAKTVSNAFTRPDQLSARLRGQVLEAAERMGYPGPDPLAAGLRRGRVGSIGVAYDAELSYAFDDPVVVALLAGVASVAEPAGTGLLLIPGSAPPDRATALTRAVVDGIIVNSVADDDPVLHAAIARRLPLVVIDQPAPQDLARLSLQQPSWVGIDDRAGAAQLAEHLLRLGHQRLAVVSFGLNRAPFRGLVDEESQAASTYAVTRERLAGYRDAVRAHGLDWAAIPVIEGTISSALEGRVAAAAVLARHPRPTALLCLSDRVAEGALEAARTMGLQVPDDLSVVGFDDSEPARRLGITTIRQDHRRKGEFAAQALIDVLGGRTPNPITVLPTQLVIRNSTGPPGATQHRDARKGSTA
jgi:DNA-binding LacI/PurR family transcriptional regulator